MYTQDIVVSQIVYARLKKKMEDIKKCYEELDIELRLLNDNGSYILQVVSGCSKDFNHTVKEFNLIINRLNMDSDKLQKKKKLEKEKRERKKNKIAVREIKKNIAKHEKEAKEEQNMNEITDIGMSNNMFYGLEIDVDCP